MPTRISYAAALSGCDDDVVVVAHSLAGATGALLPGPTPRAALGVCRAPRFRRAVSV